MKKVRVYFTHDTEDVGLVNSLVDILSFMGIFDVLLSPFSRPGTVPKFDDEKKAKIESCDLLIAMFTRRSLRLTLVEKEIEFARSKNKIVIPIMEQHAKIPKIGKVVGQYQESRFFKAKPEMAAKRILTITDVLQTRFGISRDSIVKARIALTKYPKQQFTFRMSKTARLATFGRIVAEAMKKLGYSIRKQPLFFLVRGRICK